MGTAAFPIPRIRVMSQEDGARKRRTFYWSDTAKLYVEEWQQRVEKGRPLGLGARKRAVVELSKISGNPYDACLRFLNRLGIAHKQRHQSWTKPEQQRLIDLINSMPVAEAARVLGRTPSSVYAMLHRLGLSSRQMREWFTPSMLAECLHISRQQVQQWIDRRWLPRREVQTRGIKMQVIDADDFCSFIEEYGRQVVGRRLSYDGLLFVRNYVCPPKHADMLEVRGTYKKAAVSVTPAVTSAEEPRSERDEQADDEGDFEQSA